MKRITPLSFLIIINISFSQCYTLFGIKNCYSQWVYMGYGIGNKTVTSFTNCGSYIFAGTDGSGVYISTNNGQNWTQISLNDKIVTSLAAKENNIFAGTHNQSVWRRSIPEIIEIKNISNEIPYNFFLEQNYPNPFNSTTSIEFQIPKAEDVKLIVYDLLGREVATLVNEKLQAGTYQVNFNASQLPSGVYLYRLVTENFTDIKKMILIK